MIRQTFNLGKKISEAIDASRDYEELISYEGWQKFKDNYSGADVYGAYGKAISKAKKNIGESRTALGQSTLTYGIAAASFAYNYAAKTTRFGLRGQDIQDQLKVQDKLVNAGFGIMAATVVGGVGAGALALAGTLVSELISVSIQNARYEYNKSIDREQKAILQERIGRAVYNGSRR